ncbi:MAG TPA: hypothetical protein VGZ23_19635 [bacterium]|nr:hypothetical protein [bacterium]
MAVAVTVPLAQAGSAAILTITPAQAQSDFEAAKGRAGCISPDEKTTLRNAVALLALNKATQHYAKQRGIAPNENAFLMSSDARPAITAYAAKMYRRYLIFLGHRLILARGADCTRSIVAFLNGSGLHVVAEEELAQVGNFNTGPLELDPDPSYQGGAGCYSCDKPVDLFAQGGGNALDPCCGSISLWNVGQSFVGYSEIILAMGVMGISFPSSSPVTINQIMGGLFLLGKGLSDLAGAATHEAGASH